MFLWFCFVFKQKTAYEMRISDWSSDVCSSDLVGEDERHRQLARAHRGAVDAPDHQMLAALLEHQFALGGDRGAEQRLHRRHAILAHALVHLDALREVARSEEHTSELQSLMRISYAVFCLKTKHKHYKTHTHNLTKNIH